MRRDASLTRTDPFDGAEVWFLTGSQGLYGEETLQQVAEQSQRVAAALDAAAAVPAANSYEHVLSTAYRWSREIPRPQLMAGVFPDPAFTRWTYQLSSALWR